jgi:hypothetical protein
VVAVKAILPDVPPILFAFIRFGTASFVLLAVLRWRDGSVGLPRADIVPMFMLPRPSSVAPVSRARRRSSST